VPAPARARGVVARPKQKRVSAAAQERKSTGARLAACSAVVVVVFGALAVRVAKLQLMSGNQYLKAAVEQSLHTIPLPAERGSIFDRNGRDLAISIERSTIYADPTLVPNPAATAAKLAPILKEPVGYLRKQLSARPLRFSYLAHTVDDATALRVRNLNLPGIGFVPEPARSYPDGDMGGALIGHVGGEGSGLDGIEYLYNSLLTGKSGELVVEKDPQGHDIPGTQRTDVNARRGTDVVLSIDQDLQYETEHSLLDQVIAQQAQGGMAAVMDLQTGDVLSMASIVGPSRTAPAHIALAGDRNTPLTDLFEPGSTNKLITLSWAIEHHFVTPKTMFQVPYSIRVDPHVKPYTDAEAHLGVPNGVEHWTTADILRESSNVGTIEIAQRMHNHDIADALRAFGLGTKTSIDWPGQPNGLLIDPSQYYATGKYSSAIGYGVAVTGMQMLDAFATIANGGMTRPPRLIDATIDAHGKRHSAMTPPSRRVVSQTTATTMTTMLEGVVAGGTGVCAAIPGYPVAGKTGTAKKLLPTGQYSEAHMTSFMGFAPADHPRFAAMVVLDSPTGSFASMTAAPVWSEIMQSALTRYSIAPTDVRDAQFNAAQHARPPGMVCTVPHGPDLAAAVARAHAAQAAAALATQKAALKATKKRPSSLSKSQGH
jgi:cell division protein FtsI (penicillin-binding protein 3)